MKRLFKVHQAMWYDMEAAMSKQSIDFCQNEIQSTPGDVV